MPHGGDPVERTVQIQFEDEDSPRTVIVDERLPDEAYQQLADGQLPETGYFLWDEATSSWRAY